jgi:hypothetical protein
MSDNKNNINHKKFPELKQKDGITNYGSWVVKAQQQLTMLNLWDVVGGNDTKPPPIPKLVHQENGVTLIFLVSNYNYLQNII